ncbi:MAG: N-acyl homoserine lactonase family protein [Burkholderiaceae bacterium]
MLPRYEVYALRYATLDRPRRDNFIATDMHDAPMPIDYFVWVIRGDGRLWLVDTGFNEATARARQRQLLRCPIDALATLGIEPQAIDEVIITHLHYDHAGNLKKLPKARIHVQERELHYACGHQMCHGVLRHAYAAEDVVDVVRGVYEDRVAFGLGDVELAPGLQLLLIGGHTDGLQSVRVHTKRGWVVLASDASHFYENIHRRSPFPIVFHVGDMLAGWQRLLSLCETPDHLVPGHDPAVLERYPSIGAKQNEVVCLHEPPSGPLPGLERPAL